MTKTTNSRRPRKMAREPIAESPSADGSNLHVPTDTDGEGPAIASCQKAHSKAAQVLDLLRRPEGATLAQMVEATGWLPHTTRAALTGLRKKGHAITKDKVNGTTRYSIAPVTGE